MPNLKKAQNFHPWPFLKKPFHIFLIFVLFFQQLVWAMDSVGPQSPSTDRASQLSEILEKPPLVRAPSQHSIVSIQDGDSRSDEILNVENSWIDGWRWSSVDSFLQKTGYFLTLRGHEITQPDSAKRKCSAPVWLRGGSYPVASNRARKQVLFVDGLRQGVEFVVFRGIHTGITTLAVYQLYNYFNQQSPLICQGTVPSENVAGFFKFLSSSDDHVLLGFFHDVLGSDSSALSYLKYLLAAPFVWGVGKGLINTRNSSLSGAEIDGLLTEIEAFTPSIYTDIFRWLFPLHPINRKLTQLMNNALWNPDVSFESLEAIEQRLENLVTKHKGYTSIHALARLMSLAYGMNVKDVRTFARGQKGESSLLLSGVSAEQAFIDSLEDRTGLKERVFSFLKKSAQFTSVKSEKTFGKKLQKSLTTIYSKYLLWSLGMPCSSAETVGLTAFKLAKLYIQAKLIETIVNTFLKAEKCPKEPGVSLAGVEPWAKDLGEACFEASMEIFNLIPGQPTDTLVGNLDQYYFPGCAINLDLSGRGISGETVANITRALLALNITFLNVDLSGNTINTPADFEAVGPFLNDVQSLDLSYNNIHDDMSIFSLADMLFGLTKLESLSLSRNFIGFMSTNGTQAVAHSLSNLTGLTSLDMSYNMLGYKGSDGAIALGENFSKLKRLRNLNLAVNYIGTTDSYGIIGLARGLPGLSSLSFFNFSTNALGYTDSDGTVALGQALSRLEQLLSLNISVNLVGQADSLGTVSLAQGISNLTQLIELDCSGNFMGFTDSNGTAELAGSLSKLQKLTYLDLSSNVIDSLAVPNLTESLSGLSSLVFFGFLPNPITNADALKINAALKQSLSQASPLPSVIGSAEEALAFCESLNNSYQYCNLSSRVPIPSVSTISTLMQCLGNHSQITYLDLSNNLMGYQGSDSVVALGQGLGYLRQIAYLDLSKNRFGLLNSDGVVAVGEGISALTGLRTLNLLGNFLGFQDSNGLISLGQGISGLTQLESINLSNNNLGYVDSNGTAAFGQALMGLKKLTSLVMPYNYVGFMDSLGTISLGQGIANLDNITFLDLSNNFLGNTDSEGTVSIGKGLLNCSLLTHLDLSDNAIDDFDALGSVALARSIGGMKRLVYFDISYNNVDLWNSDASIALAQSLNGSQTLESVNLGNNAIGSTGPEGSQALIPVLLSLPKLKPENLNVQGMTNISWSQAASYLENRQSQAMMEACQVSQCFGGDIHVNAGAQQSLAIEAPTIHFPVNGTLTHEARALVVYNDQPGQVSFDMSTLGLSAITGAAFAALPEAVGDTLYLSGIISSVNASRLKTATNAALVFATGSWLPVGASMATSTVLQRAGVSEPTSRLAGNTAAFLISAGQSLTPTGFAAMAVNYAAGKAALFLEKFTMKWMFGREHS